MKIPKSKAIELIDEKILQFRKTLADATSNNLYDEAYLLAYDSTELLLKELFSKEVVIDFRTKVSSGCAVGECNNTKKLQYYKDHIKSCITYLEARKEEVQNFWETEEPKMETNTIPFVSMSFDDRDKDINNYIMSILTALEIRFETGERYSNDSIPAKVRNRIINSDLFIIIFVKRDEIKNGGYTTPSWLLKELGIAQGSNKEVIAWVERGIKDNAGLNYEKEVIYFDRNDINEIMKATVKFLEALKEHKLV
jgi:hypothetical protein